MTRRGTVAMGRGWWVVGVILALALAGSSVPAMHRVVFELTSDNADSWSAALNNVENLQTAFGPTHTTLELVAHGKGIGFLVNMDMANAQRIARLARQGVIFMACHNTMRRQHIRREDLLPLVVVVPSGIAEVVEKQEAGWPYIKAGI